MSFCAALRVTDRALKPDIIQRVGLRNLETEKRPSIAVQEIPAGEMK